MDDKQNKIIAELQRVANLLGGTSLPQREFRRHSDLSIKTIETTFGSWNRAIQAAGLTPIPARYLDGELLLSDDELLQEIIRVSQQLGKRPTESEMIALGHHTIKPFRKRWGTFGEAIRVAYDKYGVPLGISADASHMIKVEKAAFSTREIKPESKVLHKTYPQRKKTQYGEPINFRGLRHAPVNENGVIYVFGIVSQELGFLVESLRGPYPDCEGKRRVDAKRQRWEDVRIEFEFKSSNFRRHKHNPDDCDLIVCWIHDWDNCPLEVLELRSAIHDLPTDKF